MTQEDRNVAYAASWLVYFNGIEIPAISAQVVGGVGQIPQATITVPPSRLLRGLGQEDRIRCTVFYLDHHAYETPTYCLLFEGEIVQVAKDTTAESQGLQFIAVDMAAVLTQMFPFFVQNSSDVARLNLQTGQNTVGTASAYAPTTSTLLARALFDPSGRSVLRPFDLVMNVITLCRGEGLTGDDRSVVATQFFARWVDRVNFRYRFAPSYYLEKEAATSRAIFPILRAAQDETALDAVQRVGDRIATSGSYYALIQNIFDHVYCDLLMLLAPSATSVNPITFETDDPAAFVAQSNNADPLRDTLLNPYAEVSVAGTAETTARVPGLVQYLTKPKIFFGLPPQCNIIWPSMRAQSSYSENYARQPTRTYIGNAHTIRALNAGQQGTSDFIERALTVAYPREAQNALEGRVNAADGNLDNFLVYPEEFFKGPVYNNLNTPTWFTYLAQTKDEAGGATQRLYAAMEHFRARGAQKNGSEAMAFNPYVLYGFPILVVDPSEYNNHLFADCVTVTHTLGQQQMSTTVAYTMAQRIDEVVLGVSTAAAEANTAPENLAFAPSHPLEELRTLFQRVDNAQEFYNRVLYKRTGERGCIDWREIFGVATAEGVEDIDFTFGSRAFEDYTTGYVPFFALKGPYADVAPDHRASMRSVARPVCTLEQYIDFCGAKGVRDARRTPDHPTEGKMADYYVRILNLTQGPGLEPGTRRDGSRCSVLEADTRVNWERRLLAYRDSVYNDLAPQIG